ncbi:30 kDa spicule matrix protein-like [Diadema antillarum]|uniref:30 kDa spicule matrix protein-like n=1 Tax=Diadema antillarum TaxID=105358 RepID=UPI003A89591A
MKCLLLAGLLALCCLASAHMHAGETSCQDYFTYFNGSCYRLTQGEYYDPATRFRTRLEGMSFHLANRHCQSLHPDAHLLVINDQPEHEFVFNWIPSIDPLEIWIGLFFNATTMQYEWVNGDPVLYTAWEPYYGEPLIRQGGAAMMFVSEVFTPQVTRLFGYGLEVSPFWISEMADEPLPFICEYSLLEATEAPTTNTTDFNSTAMPPITGTSGPQTMAPQVLFQQEPRPIRLSDYLGFGALHERKIDNSKRGRNRNVGAPQAYKKRGNYMDNRRRNYGYGYPVLP